MLGASVLPLLLAQSLEPLIHEVTSMTSSLIKDVYVPKDFIHHAVSLDQAFAHCRIFSAAAPRRGIGRVSVRSAGVTLSGPLCVIATVGRYPTVKLIHGRPLQKRKIFTRTPTLASSLFAPHPLYVLSRILLRTQDKPVTPRQNPR